MKAVQLGDLEKEVMDIVWEKKHCSTRDVLTKLNKKLAYTTIATILKRLFDKDLVVRKEDKTGYTYSPKLTKEKYSRNIAKSFLDKFTKSFGDTAIASFADCIDRLPAKKRSYFLKLLNEHDKNK